MTDKPKRWHEVVAEMPRLTAEQIEAVKRVVDYHLGSLIFDLPKVDEATWAIQRDVDAMKATP